MVNLIRVKGQPELKVKVTFKFTHRLIGNPSWKRSSRTQEVNTEAPTPIPSNTFHTI